MSEPSAKLDHNPLIVALANAVTELNTDGTEALRRWRHDRTVVDEINQLAKDADLSDSLVIEIEFEEKLLERDGWKHPDRWRIRVNHPVPKRNPITVYLGAFPLVHAKAALPEIVNHLRAWQTAAAFGGRMPDENGRPLPVSAIDRSLVIADRIELQQASDGSAAKEQRHNTVRRASPALSLKQFGKALIMDPYRVFKPRALAEWDLKSDNDANTKWTIDYNLLHDSGKERQIQDHAASLRDKQKKSSAA